jgi:LysR family transcriptional regulator for metE and metH
MSPPTLDVRHLTLVHEIAATGSVTRAAEKLHLTQSALSHQLRDIESRLSVQLFLRLGRRMVLTPAGERVLASARRVLDDLGRTEDELRTLAEPDSGVLRLCTQCHTGYHWLPRLLHAFHRQHPGVDVQIMVDATKRPLEALLDGQIDLALVNVEPADRHIVTTPLFKDELVAVVAPSHPWATRRNIDPRDFAGTHLLLYSADRHDSYSFREILTPNGVEPARVSAVPLTEAILELVKAGFGVSVLARWAAEPAIRSGAVAAVRIGRRGVYRQWLAARLRERVEPPWQKSFVELLATDALPVKAPRGEARRSAR